MTDIVERLRQRTNEVLPPNWQKGLECPGCGYGAERPKCFFDMGGGCPRHDPENYDTSPYVEVPDKLSQEAAVEIERLRDEIDTWKSVFPDIAPEQVLPDRSLLKAEIERLRAVADGQAEAWDKLFKANDTLLDLERNCDTTKRFDRALMDQQLAEEAAKEALAAYKETQP